MCIAESLARVILQDSSHADLDHTNLSVEGIPEFSLSSLYPTDYIILSFDSGIIIKALASLLDIAKPKLDAIGAT